MGFVYLPFGFPCQLAVFSMKHLIAETLGLMRLGKCRGFRGGFFWQKVALLTMTYFG